MNKTIDYQFNSEIKAAWQNLLAATYRLDQKPLIFLTAARDFFLSIHFYHQSIDRELGSDDLGHCIEQLATWRQCILNERNAKRLKQIVEGCVDYPLYVNRKKITRHNMILNEAPRDYLSGNELQSWYFTLARYLPLVTTDMQVMVRSKPVLFNHMVFPDQKNYLYASLLIDLSEDYFFEVVFAFIHSLSVHVSSQKADYYEKHIIRELIHKANELLYDRTTMLAGKYQELALLSVYYAHNFEALHHIIDQFVTKIPPGLSGYHKVAVGKKKRFILQKLEQTKALFKHKINLIDSKVVTFNKQQKFYEDPSIQGKLNNLPYYLTATNILTTVSEDYFLSVTFQFIQNLSGYVFQNPEANIIHDRHHVIKTLLKNAFECLFDRETPPIIRLKELATLAIELDRVEKGKVHEIIQKFVAHELSLSEYSRREIPVKERSAFVGYKSQVYASRYHRNHPWVLSELTNEKIQKKLLKIPRIVVGHLEKNYQEDPTPFWKFLNWFLSIFDFYHPLKREVGKTNVAGIDIPEEIRSISFHK